MRHVACTFVLASTHVGLNRPVFGRSRNVYGWETQHWMIVILYLWVPFVWFKKRRSIFLCLHILYYQPMSGLICLRYESYKPRTTWSLSWIVWCFIYFHSRKISTALHFHTFANPVAGQAFKLLPENQCERSIDRELPPPWLNWFSLIFIKEVTHLRFSFYSHPPHKKDC